MTPDADIDGLVRRLRAQAGVTPAAYQPNVTLHMISPVEQPTLVMPSLLTKAAALIEALRKEREDLLTRAQTQHSRILTSNHQYLARASAAEQKLAEIAEIAGNADKRGWNDFDRIAALARSTSTNGG